MAAHKHAGELLWTEEPYVQVLDDALIQNMQRSTLIPFWKPSFFGYKWRLGRPAGLRALPTCGGNPVLRGAFPRLTVGSSSMPPRVHKQLSCMPPLTHAWGSHDAAQGRLDEPRTVVQRTRPAHRCVPCS